MKKGKIKKIFSKGPSVFLRTQAISMAPSCYHILRPNPYDLFINITDNCCHRCLTCMQWRTITKNELSTSEWKDVIRQAAELKISSLTIMGGEPLLRKDLEQVISFAKKLRFDIKLITNSFLIDPKRARNLSSAGLDSAMISIDGTEKVHDKIRGRKGAYKKALEGIKELTENNIEVIISTTISKINIAYVMQVAKLAKQKSVQIVFNYFDQTPYFFNGLPGRNELKILESDLPKIDKLVDDLIKFKRQNPGVIADSRNDLLYGKKYFRDNIQKNLRCSACLTRIMIGSQGDVYGGCWSMGKFGNLRQKSLKEIFFGPSYKQKHKKMFFKNCPGCACGYQVNLDYNANTCVQEFFSRIK